MVRPTKNKAVYGPYTIVIKLGTSSIIHETTHQPLLSILSSIVETVVTLRSQGHKVVLVSSGAIGVGMKRMELPARPKALAAVQALAAIGQGRLIALWDNLFNQLGQPIAQVLLTRGDLSDRTRYLNAVNTFGELLSMGVVPIVNENDTVSVSEIRFGDNDSLSAVTASMIHADFLFLLTDVDGLYTSNPRKDPDAKFIKVVESVMDIRKQVSTATLGSKLGTGGMETKLIAAEIASAGGVSTIICKSSNPANVLDIIGHIGANKLAASSAQPVPTAVSTPSSVMKSDSEDGSRSMSSSLLSITPTATAAPVVSTPTLLHSNQYEARPLYTLFKPSEYPLRDVKSWTAYALAPSGNVVIDVGAHAVLSRRESGGRLLAVGVVGVAGRFAPGQAVRILVRRHLERKEHHQLIFGHQQKGSMGTAAELPAFKEVADSQGASPATPSSPSLSPACESTIGSISTMELSSRSASHGSLEAEAADVEATPMVSKITLEPDAHDHNEGLEGRTPSGKVIGDSSESGKKTHVHVDVKPEGEWIDVEVGRGLANYNSADITKVMGMKSTNMVKVLGYADSEYVVENITIRLAP